MTTQRSRRAAERDRDQALEMFMGCIGAASIFGAFVPQLLVGPIGILLAIGAILFAGFTILFHCRRGGSAAGALILLTLVGSVTAGVILGGWWWFQDYMSSRPLFELTP